MHMVISPFIMMSYSIMLVSSLLALSSTSWFMFWMGMEINLLSFVPIILLSSKNQETEAAIKYFLAQALGSSILLMFSSTLWSVDYMNLSNLAAVVLLVSMLFKLGAAPAHFWYPSVMSSISWVSCLILTTWQKLAPLCAISFFLLHSQYQTFLISMGSLNAIAGGILGLNQSKLRSIMAYSSIGHIGWMLSLAAIQLSVCSFVYFLMYCFLVLPLFLIMGALNMSSLKNISKLISLSPFLVFAISALFLSLGGLPPLTGFMPKMMTIYLMLDENFFYVMALILGSVMNLCFYLNIIMSFMVVPTFMLMPSLSFNYIKWVVAGIIYATTSLVFILLVH